MDGKDSLPSTQTRSISVPTGHIIANVRWQNQQQQASGDLITQLKASIPVHFENSPSSVIDFYPASNAGVIYLFESDVVEGVAYKRKAARLRKASRLRGVVLAEKTPFSTQYYQNVQKFCVTDLGLYLIPVRNQSEAASFLVQMVYAETSSHKNPFAAKPSLPNKDVALVASLGSMPGLGDTKVKLILNRYPSIHTLMQASQEDLSEVIGKASAVKLFSTLHGTS